MDDLSDPQRIAVVGAGSIGTFFACVAASLGHDVTLCVRRQLPAVSLRTDGRLLTPPLRQATSPEQLGPHPWVFLATKLQDTASTEPWLRRLVDGRTRIVTLQNGLDHRDRVERMVSPAAVLPGIVQITVERAAAGRFERTYGDRVTVESGVTGDAFVRLLAGSGLDVRLEPDIHTASWLKLMANGVVNPLTALTLRRADVVVDGAVEQLRRQLLDEAARVAAADGAQVGPEDVDRLEELLTGLPTDNATSMLSDRIAGRPLEFEGITGTILAKAATYGVDVPTHRILRALLAACSGHELPPAP